MKKIIIGLMILLHAAFVKAAGNNDISDKILQSFQKEFTNVSNVYWTSLDNKKIFRASFLYEGHSTVAFYDEGGDLLRTIRLISDEELPIMIMRAISAGYNKYSINSVEEYSDDDMLYYVVTMQDEKKTVSVSFSPYGEIQRVKKIKYKNF